MIPKPKYYLLLVIFSFVSFLIVQSQEKKIIEKINQKQGLSNSRITGIVKDEDGFIWISTQDGLNKYDGFNFEVFQKKNSNISSNDITHIIRDSKNRIWVATLGGGISLYDKQKNNFRVIKKLNSEAKSIISNQINILFEDTQGFIWIGTDNGVSKINPVSFNYINFQSLELSNINVTSFYEGMNGDMYIGTFGRGLFVLKNGHKSIEKIKVNQQEKIKYINVLSSLNNDNLLVGTSYHGLMRFDLNTNLVTDYFKENNLNDTPDIVRSVKTDSRGNLWVGSDGKGLFKIESPNSTKVKLKKFDFNPESKSGLSGNAIYVIAEINNNSIWIGTAWNGLNVINYKDNSELIYSDIKGEKPFPVLSINKSKNSLFIGSDGNGLTTFNFKDKSIKKLPIDANYIQHISINDDRFIWLGTFANGLIKYDLRDNTQKKYVNTINDNSSISFNNVRDLIFEGDSIWVGTWGGGLNLFDKKKQEFKTFTFNDSIKPLNNRNIVSLENDDNKIWIATFGGGLNMFEKRTKKFKNFKFSESNHNSISSNYIFSLLKDSRNNLWIGSSGAGISRMNLKDFSITRFEEYKYSTITSIIEDNENNIWFGSKNGILKYDYKDNAMHQVNVLYGDYHLNSTFIDKDNYLYFGGINGITKFNPSQIDLSFNPIKVFITDFKLFNKKVPITDNGILQSNIQTVDEITLNYSDNVFTFNYAGIKYPFSKDLEYAIKLENFDEQWREVGKDRTATFTNLSPGEYIFKVKAKEIDDEWKSDYTSIRIKVLKPFWSTWWAILFYLFLIVLIAYYLRKNFIEKGKLKSSLEFEKLMHEKDNEIYKLKQQFFTNISHEIRTPVTLIISSINRLFNNDYLKDGRKIKAANTIRRNSNLLLRLVNELLDVKKLENNDITLKVAENNIVSFVKEIYSSFSDVASDRNINYELKTDLSKSILWFDKNQLEKVIFNLISNAFKFTHDNGEISIIISEEQEKVVIKIKDNGIGLSKENQKKIFKRFYQVDNNHSDKNRGFGLGLSIVQDIVKLHKGKITVESEIKEGSVFEVILKKGTDHLKEYISDNLLSKFSNDNKTIIDLKRKVNKKKGEVFSVLVVEDNVEIQDYVKDLLENSNYSVIQAFNGLEGLQKVTKYLPDLIITDIMMPEMDGTELIKKVKTNSITSYIPIIVLTAKTAIEDKRENFQLGADDYITKPFDDVILLSRIKNLLKNRKFLKNKFGSQDIFEPKKININSKDQKFLESVYKIFEENLETSSLNAVMVSEKMNMSHSTLYKKIKILTGLTFVEFLRDYKLSVAKQLIQETGYSVSEASYKVGYSDNKYFSKLFKAKFKKSPSYFLKK